MVLFQNEKPDSHSGYSIFEYKLEDKNRLLKIRQVNYGAIRKLVLSGELKGNIDEAPVEAAKPGVTPNTNSSGIIRIHEESSRLREILLRHPEVVEVEGWRLRHVSANEFVRFFKPVFYSLISKALSL